MARTLQTPVIKQPINAFDPSFDKHIEFIYSDNQIVKITASIEEKNGSVTVSEQIVEHETMLSYYLIEKGTLEAGKTYSIKIKVSDVEGNSSVYSEPVTFCCYTNPTFGFNDITSDMIYRNASITLSLNYSQNDGEKLNSYQFQLYSKDNSLLNYSKLYYYAESKEMTHTFNLDNNTDYYVRAIGETVHGMQLDTGNIKITTEFVTLPPSVVLNLENHRCEGYISIKTNILNVGYELYKDDSDHYDLSNGILTLKNGNYLNYNKGYEVDDMDDDKGDNNNFSLFVEAKLLPLNKEFLICSYDKNPIFCLKIINVCGLYYCRLYDYNSELVLCELLPNAKISTEEDSIITSLDENMVEVIDTNYNDNDFTIFEVKRVNGVYSLNVYYKSDVTS